MAKNLDMDILGALPVELSIKILKYLTPAESILLRLVSKSYHDLLTSEEVCSSLSRHFIKREYNAAKKLDSWRLHYENHVSRRLAYGFGKPWMIEILRHSLNSFCAETGYFAYMPEECDAVQVLDLNSYPAEFVLPPTRTPDSSEIKDVVLLSSFVAVVTWTGHGYSWNLETHRLYRFEVPDFGSSFIPIDGTGNLILITSGDLVIIHDLQAEKASSFKGIGDNKRIWEGVEHGIVCSDKTFAISNAENRAVWLFRELRRFRRSFNLESVFAVDSLCLETGEPVIPGEVRSFSAHGQSYCGNGRWQFWGDEPFRCRPGPAQHTTNAQAKRVVLDTGTGAWTEEAYTIMFPCWLPKFCYQNCYFRPITLSGGLGCFIESYPYPGVWMLDQEPGDRVTRARMLAFNALADLRASGGGTIFCLGVREKFVLLSDGCDGMITTVVVRFKGIHEFKGIHDSAR